MTTHQRYIAELTVWSCSTHSLKTDPDLNSRLTKDSPDLRLTTFAKPDFEQTLKPNVEAIPPHCHFSL